MTTLNHTLALAALDIRDLCSMLHYCYDRQAITVNSVLAGMQNTRIAYFTVLFM